MGNIPLTSKNDCCLRLCLLHRTSPRPKTIKQRHPRLRPKAMAIFWAFVLPDGKASMEAKNFAINISTITIKKII